MKHERFKLLNGTSPFKLVSIAIKYQEVIHDVVECSSDAASR